MEVLKSMEIMFLAGGTLTTDGNLIINGAYVDVTTGVPLFNAHSVSGEVNILQTLHQQEMESHMK